MKTVIVSSVLLFAVACIVQGGGVFNLEMVDPADFIRYSILGNEFRVNNVTEGSQLHPWLAQKSDGGFVAVWHDSHRALVVIQPFRPDGLPDGSEKTIAPTSLTDPVIGVMSNDQMIVVSGSTDIFAQLLDSSGSPLGSEFMVNQYTTSSQSQSIVRVLSDDSFVVAWRSSEQDGDGNGVYARRFSSSGTALTNEWRVNDVTEGSQYSGRVDVLSNDNLVFVWTDVENVRVRLFTNGGISMGASIPVFRGGGQCDVAVIDGSTIVVVGTDDDGSGNGIFGRRFDSNLVPLNDTFQVSTFTLLEQRWPSVAILSDGGMFVSWLSNGHEVTAEFQVFGRQFDNAGNAVDDEFRVSAYRARTKSTPMAVGLTSGAYAVVWVAEDMDGSQKGIFAAMGPPV